MNRIAALLISSLLVATGCEQPTRPTQPADPLPEWQASQPIIYDVGSTALTRLSAHNAFADARLDLMTVARGDASIRILAGGLAGTFAGAVPFALGADTRDAVAGDVNGDGAPDLVGVGHMDNALFVRLGSTSNEFGPAARYGLRNHGHFVVVLDLNGDKFQDIVAVHDGSGAPIRFDAYLGTASGVLELATRVATVYYTAKGIAAADFNGDGKVDVAIAADDNRAAALVFHGRGGGAFADPVLISTTSQNPSSGDGTVAVGATDLNRDGRDDLVLVCQDVTNQLVVRLSTATGFGAPTLIALPSPIAVALGDVDGDGTVDAVAANLEHGSLSVLPGRGDGSFAPARTLRAGASPNSVTVHDFDLDGVADIAATDLKDHKVRIWLQQQ